MKYVDKVQKVEASACVDLLVRSFYAVVGSKGFMRDVEKILEERLQDLTGMESESLCMLARALRQESGSSGGGDNKKPWVRF